MVKKKGKGLIKKRKEYTSNNLRKVASDRKPVAGDRGLVPFDEGDDRLRVQAYSFDRERRPGAVIKKAKPK